MDHELSGLPNGLKTTCPENAGNFPSYVICSPISFTVVPINSPLVPESSTGAVQLFYRFDNGLAQSCIIRGTHDVKFAENVFLGQFNGHEPEIVGCVKVWLPQ
jgi:hypothetical protein